MHQAAGGQEEAQQGAGVVGGGAVELRHLPALAGARQCGVEQSAESVCGGKGKEEEDELVVVVVVVLLMLLLDMLQCSIHTKHTQPCV